MTVYSFSSFKLEQILSTFFLHSVQERKIWDPTHHLMKWWKCFWIFFSNPWGSRMCLRKWEKNSNLIPCFEWAKYWCSISYIMDRYSPIVIRHFYFSMGIESILRYFLENFFPSQYMMDLYKNERSAMNWDQPKISRIQSSRKICSSNRILGFTSLASEKRKRECETPKTPLKH